MPAAAAAADCQIATGAAAQSQTGSGALAELEAEASFACQTSRPAFLAEPTIAAAVKG